MDRNSLQQDAADRLFKNQRLICQWATGTGKSGVVLKFLQQHPCSCLILVPEQNNIENWQTEFEKFGISMLGVTIICYASFKNYKNTKWGLIVFDEAPHIDTDIRRNIGASVSADYVLALGARITDEEVFALESLFGTFDTSRISLGKAVATNILPSPEIYILHMTMDNLNPTMYFRGQRCTPRTKYNMLQRDVDEAVSAYNKVSSNPNKMRMQRCGLARKKFLGEMKENAMRWVCSQLNEKHRRFLCFCSSIKQAETLGGEYAFTSKTPKSMNLLNRFNNHEINSLYVVGKLIEGQNLVDIECGVIGQLGSTERITIQSIGRIMRSKNPRIYVPIFDNTKDDSFLRTLTNNIPESYIKHYKI